MKSKKMEEQINVKLGAREHKKVLEYSKEHDWTMSQAVRNIIKHYFIQLRG